MVESSERIVSDDDELVRRRSRTAPPKPSPPSQLSFLGPIVLSRSIFGHGKRNSDDYRRGGQTGGGVCGASRSRLPRRLLGQTFRSAVGALCDNAWEQDYPVLWRNRRNRRNQNEPEHQIWAVLCIVNRETRKQYQNPLHACRNARIRSQIKCRRPPPVICQKV